MPQFHQFCVILKIPSNFEYNFIFMKADRKKANFKVKILNKYSLVGKIIPLVIIIGLFKYLSHFMGFEIMELNTLFASLVAGTIFLLGFLISGILSDYKESEKLPSELSASLRTLFDDAYTICKSKNSDNARHLIEHQKQLIPALIDWFYKKERTKTMLAKISNMNQYIIELDKEAIQANYIIKLKNEQSFLRKTILRIDTIRATEFVSTAFAIVEEMGIIIAVGMIIMKIEPFYASLFFTLLVTFLISYVFFLIKDLDNPFDYSIKGECGSEISLKPIHDLMTEINDDNYLSENIEPCIELKK
jgi:hypothetical protein